MRGREAAPSDRDLLNALVEKHDEGAFAILVQRHGPMVLSVCRRMLRNECDADAFQATFLFLAKKPGAIRNGESLHSWLYKVAFRVSQRFRLQLPRRKVAEMPRNWPTPRLFRTHCPGTRSASRSTRSCSNCRRSSARHSCCAACPVRRGTRRAEELGWTLNALERAGRGRKLPRRGSSRGVELSAVLLAATLTQIARAASLPRGAGRGHTRGSRRRCLRNVRNFPSSQRSDSSKAKYGRWALLTSRRRRLVSVALGVAIAGALAAAAVFFPASGAAR